MNCDRRPRTFICCTGTLMWLHSPFSSLPPHTSVHRSRQGPIDLVNPFNLITLSALLAALTDVHERSGSSVSLTDGLCKAGVPDPNTSLLVCRVHTRSIYPVHGTTRLTRFVPSRVTKTAESVGGDNCDCDLEADDYRQLRKRPVTVGPRDQCFRVDRSSAGQVRDARSSRTPLCS